MSQIIRLGDSGNAAGEVDLISATWPSSPESILNPDRTVTAVRRPNGRLQILLWSYSEDRRSMSFISSDLDEGERIRAVSSTFTMPENCIFTAVQTEDNRLKAICWRVLSSESRIAKLGDSGLNGPLVRKVAATYGGDMTSFAGGAITAIQDWNDRLRILGWNVEPSGQVSLADDSLDQAGEVSLISATWLIANNNILTAVRTVPSGELKLIAWGQGEEVERRGDSGSHEAIDQISLTHLRSDYALTAVRLTESRALKLILWRVSENGAEIVRVSDSGSQAGEVEEVKIVRIRDSHAVTAVRTSDGRLKLIHWFINFSDNKSISRMSDSGDQAGLATEINIESVAPITNRKGATVATAVRTSEGLLKVITWSVGPFPER